MAKEEKTKQELLVELKAATKRIHTLESRCSPPASREDKTVALTNSTDYLRSLLQTIPDLIWLKDRDGVYLSCNSAFELFFGATEEEIVGKTDYDFVPKELADFFRDHDRRAMNSGSPSINEEWLMFKRNGYRGLFETIKTPMLDQQGNLIGVLGISRDITDRKQVEEALEQRMIALTKPMDEAGNLTFSDLFNIDDIQRLQDEFAQATGVASLILTPDGTPITKPSNFCRLCNDIIRKTEKGLANCRHSDTRIGTLSNNGPIVQPCLSGGLWDAGAGISVGGRHIASWLVGQVRNVAQTEEQMRKYAREIGADEDDVVKAFREVPSMPRKRFNQVAQVLYTLADQLSSIAYQNVQQARFIFERKQAEQELIEMRDQAEQASRVKSEFLANMSHEIRTPLNGVLGMLQLMELTKLSSEQQEYLDTAVESTRRLTRLLTDILDISRIEAGKMEIKPLAFDLENLKKSILGLFSPAAKDKGNELVFTIGEDLPSVLIGDEARLRQILFNLVGNAIKFTKNGTISVQIDKLSSIRPGQTRALFSISDTGIGISDHKIREIFDPFVQAEGSYSRRFQGAGLGLSIVRKLVSLMHGSLSIDSAEDEGTTIYLSLPFDLPETSPGTPEHAHRQTSHESSSGLRILLAEDDATSRVAGKILLEKAGHTVTAAQNGKRALDLLDSDDFDLILMDVQMPELGGVEATGLIRNDERFGHKARIPIIAMTAYAMAGDREAFLAEGMDGYIAKPVDSKKLLKTIDEVLNQVRSGK